MVGDLCPDELGATGSTYVRLWGACTSAAGASMLITLTILDKPKCRLMQVITAAECMDFGLVQLYLMVTQAK